MQIEEFVAKAREASEKDFLTGANFLQQALEIIEAQREAIKKLSTFRADCHAYDDDMGYERRAFGDEEWDMIENQARAVLEREV